MQAGLHWQPECVSKAALQPNAAQPLFSRFGDASHTACRNAALELRWTTFSELRSDGESKLHSMTLGLLLLKKKHRSSDSAGESPSTTTSKGRSKGTPMEAPAAPHSSRDSMDAKPRPLQTAKPSSSSMLMDTARIISRPRPGASRRAPEPPRNNTTTAATRNAVKARRMRHGIADLVRKCGNRGSLEYPASRPGIGV